MKNNNYRKVKQILWIILLINLAVALLKILIGNFMGSTSMSADGFHSLSDGVSNIVGIIGIWLASKPVDEDHPYGHNKFEVITGFFIGIMLLYLGFKTGMDAVEKLNNPFSPNITIVGIAMLVFTLILNVFVCLYEYKMGKKMNSYILISDSLHTRSDIFISIGVLLGLIGIKCGLPKIIDPIISLVISGFIFQTAYEIFKSTIDVLVDKAVVNTNDIREIISEFDEIKCCHDIRSRGSENSVHIDMHIHLDANTTVEVAHKLSHDIEDRIKEKINENAQVIIHIEPYPGYCRL